MKSSALHTFKAISLSRKITSARSNFKYPTFYLGVHFHLIFKKMFVIFQINSCVFIFLRCPHFSQCFRYIFEAVESQVFIADYNSFSQVLTKGFSNSISEEVADNGLTGLSDGELSTLEI